MKLLTGPSRTLAGPGQGDEWIGIGRWETGAQTGAPIRARRPQAYPTGPVPAPERLERDVHQAEPVALGVGEDDVIGVGRALVPVDLGRTERRASRLTSPA